LPILVISTNLVGEFLDYQGPAKAALGQRFFILIGLVMGMVSLMLLEHALLRQPD